MRLLVEIAIWFEVICIVAEELRVAVKLPYVREDDRTFGNEVPVVYVVFSATVWARRTVVDFVQMQDIRRLTVREALLGPNVVVL